MNEFAARQVLFVRAVESVDAQHRPLTEDDLGYASRAAAELVRWQATDRGERASSEAYVAKRAQLLAEKLQERSPKLVRTLDALRWRPWIGGVAPVVAFIFGMTLERIADPGRVNILAFPLLGIIAWNLAAYVWLAVRAAQAAWGRKPVRPSWLHRVLAGARNRAEAAMEEPLAAALAHFALDWSKRCAPLVAARAGRILHACAAALALGAVAGLYLRGLAFEYRAGWESTFLDAGSVHALLAFFLEPAARLVGTPFPSVEEIAAVRWSATGGGENAGRWIGLYAVAVMAAVVGPRLLLALAAGLREWRLSTRFPLSLEEAYLRRMIAGWRTAPSHVRVQAYAYTPAHAAAAGLQQWVGSVLGEDVQVHWAPPVAFGDEDACSFEDAASHDADLVIALFNLGATPETENHGVFLDRLKARFPAKIAIVVDEGPYRERLGNQAGAPARIAERQRAWTGFGTTRDLHALFVDLTQPGSAAAQAALDEFLAGRAATT